MECFRFCLSLIGHRISPLAIKYKPPHLLLFFEYNIGFVSIAFHLAASSTALPFQDISPLLVCPLAPLRCTIAGDRNTGLHARQVLFLLPRPRAHNPKAAHTGPGIRYYPMLIYSQPLHVSGVCFKHFNLFKVILALVQALSA